MKNKSLFIVLMFVITAIIIAVAIFLRFGTIERNFSGWFSSDSKNVEAREIKVDAFKDIDIDADILALEIQRGDDYHVEYTVPDNFSADIEVSGDTLEITVKGKNVINIGNKFGKNNFKFVVYVPEDAVFGKIEGDIDAGSVDIANAVVEKIELNASAADIQLKGLTVGDSKLKADAGNIEIVNSTFGDVNIDTDAGNVEMDDVNAEDVIVTTEMGNIELKKVFFKTGEMESDLGNIEVRGTFDSVKAECSLGAVTIYPENPDTAKIDAQVSLGSINIGGKNINGKSYRN